MRRKPDCHVRPPRGAEARPDVVPVRVVARRAGLVLRRRSSGCPVTRARLEQVALAVGADAGHAAQARQRRLRIQAVGRMERHLHLPPHAEIQRSASASGATRPGRTSRTRRAAPPACPDPCRCTAVGVEPDVAVDRGHAAGQHAHTGRARWSGPPPTRREIRRGEHRVGRVVRRVHAEGDRRHRRLRVDQVFERVNVPPNVKACLPLSQLSVSLMSQCELLRCDIAVEIVALVSVEPVMSGSPARTRPDPRTVPGRAGRRNRSATTGTRRRPR